MCVHIEDLITRDQQALGVGRAQIEVMRAWERMDICRTQETG